MLLILINIYDHVLHVLLEELFYLISHLRVIALRRLDSDLQLRLFELCFGLRRIDSGILQQQIAEFIFVSFKVLVQVVPLNVVHFLGIIFILITICLAAAIMSLELIIIIEWGIFMILGSLRHRWEEDKGPHEIVVKESFQLVSQGLKLQLVILHALKHDGLVEMVLVGTGGLGFHLDLEINSFLISEPLETIRILLLELIDDFLLQALALSVALEK